VSVCSVEVNVNGAVALGPPVVSLLTGDGEGVGSYVEMTSDDACRLSDLLADGARLAAGDRSV